MIEQPFTLIHPNVTLGADPRIDTHCLIGAPPRGKEPGEVELILGDRCRIRSHNVIYAGNLIGHDFQTGHHVFIREENTIGDDVSIGTMTVIEHHVRIGNRVRLHCQAFVPEYSVLENDCWIGPNVAITNAAFPMSPRAKEFLAGAHIERGAKIGANATLLPGVRIGAGALVGAGSLVTRDVEPGMVVAGNPARPIKSVSDLAWPDGEKAYLEQGSTT